MKKIILAVIVLFALVILFKAMEKPDEFRVTREMHINAPVSKVFAEVNNLHNWQHWSPWAKLDPNAKMTYEGPAKGENAAMSWDGNKDVGKGKMTIIESYADEKIIFQLDFIEPMEAQNGAEFLFKPEGEGTLVTWSMYGPATITSKIIDLLMNCEKKVGDQFEQGLKNLNDVVSAQ